LFLIKQNITIIYESKEYIDTKTKRIPQLQNFNRQYSKNFIFVYLYKKQ